MEDSVPLHVRHEHKLLNFVNRSHTLLHSIALAHLIYYRASFFFNDPETRPNTPTLPWLLVFASELLLSFIWLLGQAYRWRSVSRTVYIERLPEDDNLPAIDVFICTADPDKEPTLNVMNTVISAMALDYPAEKLNIYLSDDGGSPATLLGLREALGFAEWWVPFCAKYRIVNRCPEAFFEALADHAGEFGRSHQFMEDMKKTKEKYAEFKDQVVRGRERSDEVAEGTGISAIDHPAVIEVLQAALETSEQVKVKLPLLVYVSREKTPSHSHHFKAGALNVLQRVSGVVSNSPHILVLDCDMYCNDPTSARQAMCFYLTPDSSSSSIAVVQFPQRFRTVRQNDIYDSQLRSLFSVQWQGMDGLNGPVVSGTGFYITRASLYGSSYEDTDISKLGEHFGGSNEFIKSLSPNYKPNLIMTGSLDRLLKETHLLASCTYENGSKWGQEVGFSYGSVVEDYLTGLMLHCKGWTSVFCDPTRPQFLGSGATNLNDLLIQGTRWSSGLFEVGISRFCPLIYGPLRMSILQSMCYAQLAFFPLYCIPLWCFALLPQICLLYGIPLYPQVSSPSFLVFSFVFFSSVSQDLYEVFASGGSFQTWINEQRVWMMKSVTSHSYGCLDAFMKKMGMREASFLPTNKVVDEEQIKRYNMGIYDFQASLTFLAPIVALVILNIISMIVGVVRVLAGMDNRDKMFVQIFISFYITVINYPIIEGMVIRKDNGCIPTKVSVVSSLPSLMFIMILGPIILMY